MTPEQTFHLSPSLYHRHVMETMTRRLAYAGGDVLIWQRRLRRKLRQLMGYTAIKRVPLNVRTLWTRPHPLGTIEAMPWRYAKRATIPTREREASHDRHRNTRGYFSTAYSE